jgi:hypothetical protein
MPHGTVMAANEVIADLIPKIESSARNWAMIDVHLEATD